MVRGRLVNAIGRLRDAGVKLALAMDDVPHLARAVVDDLHREQEPSWQALLAGGFADKQIRAAVTRTVASVYPRVLLEGLA